MKNVFLVERGEKHEGGSVLSAHKTREGAVKAALKAKTCFDGGWTNEEGDGDWWENGCDYVQVIEVPVSK